MNISEEQLYDIIEECLQQTDENDYVEFKVNNFDFKMLGERISGVSNKVCLDNKKHGFIIYGIEDKTLKIVGTKFDPDKEKDGGEPFIFKLNKHLFPKGIFSCHKVKYQGYDLVVFIISPAIDSPTKFYHISYLRVGTANPRLGDYPYYERKIWNNVYNKNFESQISFSGLTKSEIFDYLDVDIFLKQREFNTTLEEEKINYLISEKIISNTLSRYNITNLGAILYGKKISNFDSIRTKGVVVTVYNGLDKSANIKNLDGNKGYAIGFENLIKYVKLLLPTYEEIEEKGGKRVEKNIYPSIAIREFIANAIIHQDLSIRGQNVRIEIYQDRIEITNPGEPIIPIDRFIDSGEARNILLSDFMRLLGFCEKKGSGIDKSIKEIEKYKLPAPKIETVNGETKVTLFFERGIENLTKDDKIRACFHHCVIRYIDHNYMNNSSLRERLNLGDNQHNIAGKIIKETIEAGLIKVMDKENKANRYIKYIPIWA